LLSAGSTDVDAVDRELGHWQCPRGEAPHGSDWPAAAKHLGSGIVAKGGLRLHDRNVVHEAADAGSADWWASRRLRYNLMLLCAAPISLVCLWVVWWLFEDRLPCQQVTGFSLMFGAILFAAGLVAANICFYLGPLIERLVSAQFVSLYRRSAFAMGAGFSLLLIFIPAIGNLTVAIVGYGVPGTCQ